MTNVAVDVDKSLTEQEQFHVARRRAGLTQVDLAARCHLAQTRISRWEKGNYHLPDRHVRALWAAVRGE